MQRDPGKMMAHLAEDHVERRQAQSSWEAGRPEQRLGPEPLEDMSRAGSQVSDSRAQPRPLTRASLSL